MKFAIKNRWTGDIQFEAEIECAAEASACIKLGLAIKWAYHTGAVLTGADLTGAVLTGADLTGAVLTGAVLTGAVLRGAVLTGADLTDAVLTGADLTGADLTDAVLTGVPKIDNIDAKILAAIDAGGTLNMKSWHTCGTTHCRAGWAITLAGEGGAALEFALGSAAAGALIYAVSRPKPVPNFYVDNETAMADIRQCAAEQGGGS